jgi:hypothetical protein
LLPGLVQGQEAARASAASAHRPSSWNTWER